MSFPSIFKVIFCFMPWHKLITNPSTVTLTTYFLSNIFVLPNYWVSCNDLDVNMYFWTYMRIKDKAMLNGGWNLEVIHVKLASVFHLFLIHFCYVECRVNLLSWKVKKTNFYKCQCCKSCGVWMSICLVSCFRMIIININHAQMAQKKTSVLFSDSSFAWILWLE